MTTRAILPTFSPRFAFRATFVLSIVLLVLTCPARAQRGSKPIEVSATVNTQRVFVGEPVTLEVAVNGSQSASVPKDLAVDGFETSFLGATPRSHSFTSVINGRMTRESFQGIVFTFNLVPLNAGPHTIPPVPVTVAGQRYLTNSISIHASNPSEDRDAKLFIEVDDDSPFVGQPVRLTLTLALSDGIFGADQIEFTFPAVKGPFQVVALDQPNAQRDRVFMVLGETIPYDQGRSVIDGTPFQTYTVSLALIPRRVGSFDIGPATVRGRIQTEQQRSIFDRPRMRRFVVPSNALTLAVSALPSAGRPANFSGLIGRCSVYAEATPQTVNVGDPITLSVRVTAPLPRAVDPPALGQQLNLTSKFRVTPEADATRLEPGARVFTYTLRALSDDVATIPPLELPYFDIDTGSYETAASAPIPIEVRPTRIVTAADAEGHALTPQSAASQVEDLAGGIRHNYGADRALVDQRFSLTTAFASPLGIGAVVAPPTVYTLTALIVLVRRRRKATDPDRRRRRTALPRALAALSDPDTGDPGAVSTTVRTYIADVFARNPDGLTARDAADLITSSPASDELTARATQLLDRCDQAIYAGIGAAETDALKAGASDLLSELDRDLRKARP